MIREKSELYQDETFKRIQVKVGKRTLKRLEEVCALERDSRDRVLTRMIFQYKPAPVTDTPGQIYCIRMNDIKKLRTIKPYIVTINVLKDEVLCPYWDAYWDFKDGKITWYEFKDAYMMKAGTRVFKERVAEIRKMSEVRDVYITDQWPDDEFSVRRLFVDLFNNGEI